MVQHHSREHGILAHIEPGDGRKLAAVELGVMANKSDLLEVIGRDHRPKAPVPAAIRLGTACRSIKTTDNLPLWIESRCALRQRGLLAIELCPLFEQSAAAS